MRQQTASPCFFRGFAVDKAMGTDYNGFRADAPFQTQGFRPPRSDRLTGTKAALTATA